MATLNFDSMTVETPVEGRTSELRKIASSSHAGYHVDRMVVSIKKTEEADARIESLGTDLPYVLHIQNNLYRGVRHHVDTHRGKTMSEFIPLSELEKKEYEKFFLSFNEGKVQKYYGHPGQWNYVCPPTEWRTAKVNTYLWGRFVSSEKLNPLLEETEDKNGFFASSNFWLSPGHRSDVKEELQTKGTHAYISPLYGRDIVQQRREDGIIKTVTNEEYMKPGDFLFVIENEGTYSFQHTGMFDMFGRVFETGFNAVEHFNELAKDNQYHFIRIYDGADVMSVAQRKDTWNEQFKGKSVEEVVSKLDKEMDILEAKKEGGAFISLLPHRPGSFMYTNSKDVISKEGFQYELQNR